MNTELITLNTEQPTELMMWDDNQKLEEIRKLFAPKLSDMEFKFFVGLGKASRLNPFTREIWAVKYQENTPAQIFIGRDGYRKAAQAHADYDFHQCDAVYENDIFEVNNGEVRHSYTLVNRGQLVGAYCITKRHRSSRPMYVFAELKEYSTGKSLWNNQTGKPATMIKKVAESQCLRACFQDLLGGTYGEEEFNHQDEQRTLHIIQGDSQVDKLKSILRERDDAKGYSNNVDSIESDDVGVDGLSSSQTNEGDYNNSKLLATGFTNTGLCRARELERIEELFKIKEFSQERIKKALDYYKVNSLEELDDKQMKSFLLQLEKI